MKSISYLFLKLALLLLIALGQVSCRNPGWPHPKKAWLSGSNLIISFENNSGYFPVAVLLIEPTNELYPEKSGYVQYGAFVTEEQLSYPKHIELVNVAAADSQYPINSVVGEIVGGTLDRDRYHEAGSLAIYTKWEKVKAGMRTENIVIDGLSDEIRTGIENGKIVIVSLMKIDYKNRNWVDIFSIPLSEPTYFYNSITFYVCVWYVFGLSLWYFRPKRKKEKPKSKGLQEHSKDEIEAPAPPG